MELRDVYELWDRFDKSDIAELDVEIHGAHVSLKRPGALSLSNVASGVFAPVGSVAPQVAVSANSANTASDIKNNNNENKNISNIDKIYSQTTGTPVKAPLVGTFYKAPSPEEEPFVKVGQKVSKGDVIGIIEAMKLMNEVVATQDGIVAEILVEDGTMVEYDQTLIVLS